MSTSLRFAVTQAGRRSLGRRWMSFWPGSQFPAGSIAVAGGNASGSGAPSDGLQLLNGLQRQQQPIAQPPKCRKKVTIQSLLSQKTTGKPITMLTAYDYPTGLACASHSELDIVLVGDSLAQVCLGYSSTTELTLDEMIHHASAVSRALHSPAAIASAVGGNSGCSSLAAKGPAHPLLVADMPFGSYTISEEDTLRNAVQLVRKARVEAVKLEGGREITSTVRALVHRAGIPVMAHVGLLPQRHVALSGYRVQGRDAEGARDVLRDALALQEAGAFAIVLEAVPKELGEYITQRLRIPTIGIGAGVRTDGQVLVWDDVMGTWAGRKAKFARRFGDTRSVRTAAVDAYTAAVQNHTFPTDAESYEMGGAGEWERFLELEGERVEQVDDGGLVDYK